MRKLGVVRLVPPRRPAGFRPGRIAIVALSKAALSTALIAGVTMFLTTAVPPRMDVHVRDTHHHPGASTRR
jgi:hypothetical protein